MRALSSSPELAVTIATWCLLCNVLCIRHKLFAGKNPPDNHSAILAETNGEIIAQNAHLTYVVRMFISSLARICTLDFTTMFLFWLLFAYLPTVNWYSGYP